MGPNFYGYIAIFTLTVSLISSTMFSEAVWQRVWASATPRALYGGAVVGFVSITIVVFLSGFGGWLAFVWGYASFEAGTNPNTYLMQVRLQQISHAVKASAGFSHAALSDGFVRPKFLVLAHVAHDNLGQRC
jgi:hypothetical protein